MELLRRALQHRPSLTVVAGASTGTTDAGTGVSALPPHSTSALTPQQPKTTDIYQKISPEMAREALAQRGLDTRHRGGSFNSRRYGSGGDDDDLDDRANRDRKTEDDDDHTSDSLPSLERPPREDGQEDDAPMRRAALIEQQTNNALATFGGGYLAALNSTSVT